MPRPEALVPEFDPLDTFDLQTDWSEVVAPQRPGSAAYSVGTSEETVTIEVAYRKVPSAVRQILGYSIADRISPWLLGRPEVPIQHPRVPYLWADSVVVQAWNPMGCYAEGDGTYTAKLPALSSYHAPPFETAYQKAHITVRFKEFAGRIYSDDDPNWYASTPEYKRFVSLSTIQPKNEIVSAVGGTDGTALWWADTSVEVTGPPVIAKGPFAGGTAETPTPGTEFKGSVYTMKQTTSFNVLWRQVEESYLCDDTDDDYFVMPYPRRLLAHLGTTNADTFIGHAPGTLLFNGLGLQRKSQPVVTDTEWPLFAYDVTLQLEHFDPKRPGTIVVKAGPTGGDPEPKRGWHCFPWGPNSLWYAATRGSDTTKGTYSGETLIRETNFADIFTHVRNDAVEIP